MVIAGGALDAAVEGRRLVDLVRRPADQIRGPKPVWAAALVLVSSLGLLPIGYFAFGRVDTAER